MSTQWALEVRDLSFFCSFKLLPFPRKATQCKITGIARVYLGFGKGHLWLLSYPSNTALESPALALLPCHQDLPLAVRQCPERWGSRHQHSAGSAASCSAWEGGGRPGPCLMPAPPSLPGYNSWGWTVTHTQLSLQCTFLMLHQIPLCPELNNKFTNYPRTKSLLM